MSLSPLTISTLASAVVVLTLAAVPASFHSEAKAPLLTQIRREFQTQSPRIQSITLLQLVPFYGREFKYLLLARGIKADAAFEGSLLDEQFGLFVVDQSFSKILKVIDMFPTRRWNDYQVEIRKPLTDPIVVECQGATYGDLKAAKKYSQGLIDSNGTQPSRPGSDSR